MWNAHSTDISFYKKIPDRRNLLLERKLINRFAREQEIRYEDSLEIITQFIYNMKPININEIYTELDNRHIRMPHHFIGEIVPIFFT